MPGWVWIYIVSLIVGFVLIFLVLWGTSKRARKTIAVFKEVAGELDFQFSQTGRFSGQLPKIAGSIDGRPLSAELRSEPTSNSGNPGTRYFTVFRVSISGAPCTFTMTRRERLGSIVSRFKGKDIRFDDAYFDDAVLARAADEQAFRDYMTEDRRRAARNLLLRFDECTINRTAISAERPGITIDHTGLRDGLNLISVGAATLSVSRS